MAAEPLIVVAGENLVDRIVRADGSVDEIPGGGPFNTARALGRLGCRVAYLGRISTDPAGQALWRALVDDGVELSLAVTTDDPTLVAHATLDAAGTATYLFDWEGSAAAGLRPEEATTLPAETVALHVGTLGLLLDPMATTVAALVERVGPDALVMVDPNVRPDAIEDETGYRTRLAAVLERADVVKVSTDDLRWLDDQTDCDAWIPPARSVVLVTDGGHAVQVRIGDTAPTVLEVPPVKAVDTIGAGDAFSAGFLAAWVQAGRTRAELGDRNAVVEATRFAIRVAGWTVGRAGADPPRLVDLGEDVEPGR